MILKMLLIVVQLAFALGVAAFAMVFIRDVARTGTPPGMPSRGKCPDCESFRFAHFYRCPYCGSTVETEVGLV